MTLLELEGEIPEQKLGPHFEGLLFVFIVEQFVPGMEIHLV